MNSIKSNSTVTVNLSLNKTSTLDLIRLDHFPKSKTCTSVAFLQHESTLQY